MIEKPHVCFFRDKCDFSRLSETLPFENFTSLSLMLENNKPENSLSLSALVFFFPAPESTRIHKCQIVNVGGRDTRHGSAPLYFYISVSSFI
jgi:hypothetical protein